MSLTSYHAKLFAHELTRRAPSDSIEKLATALSEAQVDLNPHQIEAALFAFRSPLSKGAILADEVGLGKTIEAGILLAQRWAERRRRLLVICPANLRKQWSQELADKFFLPTAILEARTFSEAVRKGNLNPFDQAKIVICSYQFARAKEPYLRQTAWDLVVIDEAHRLRNVYKPGNKIGSAIKSSLAARQKVLLTATPLQNSLDELYGLVSLVDEFTFGDLRSFRRQFKKQESLSRQRSQKLAISAVHGMMSSEDAAQVEQNIRASSLWPELKERLAPICQRTLRKQVLQYVAYTKRHALVQEFTPSNNEQRLYDLVSDYLQQPNLYALPSGQRQLMTLILRKLLASSTYAISDTLAGLAQKLESAELESEAAGIPQEFAENFELLPEMEDEWAEEDEDSEEIIKTPITLTPEQREERRREIARLREFHELARSIQRNSKGEQLLTALEKGFAAAGKAQAGQASSLQQKALIFTESRRTQEYLFQLLQQTEFAGKVVLFNGSNTDEGSQRIYREWLQRHKGTERISGSMTADKRAALVEYFRDEASIMIATEAAAEGINLQFCNLIVNYDLPWNPQRIEQRIGRCHRYGQKFDVVVVNFLNKANAADMRVYQLLAEKFQLFDGVFGASDEVLGAVESGMDFEKRIASIYQQCRTPEQIGFQFNQLQSELDAEIGQARAHAQEQLLNNFDQDVIDKVRVGSAQALDRFHSLLWRVTQFSLAPYAEFASAGHSFHLRQNPFPQLGSDVLTGRYEMRKGVEDANTWRIGHPLAQYMLANACRLQTPSAEVVFDLSRNPTAVAALQPLKHLSGWLTASLLTLQSATPSDHLLFAGVCCEDASLDGSSLFGSTVTPLDSSQCRRLFDLTHATAQAQPSLLLQSHTHHESLNSLLEAERNRVVHQSDTENGAWLDAESAKLDRWAEDRRLMLEDELRELDEKIRETNRAALSAGMLQQKIALKQEVAQLEAERSRKRRDLFEAQDKVEAQRHTLFAEASSRLIQQASTQPLFTIRWRVQ